jgi:hypothetical protein
MHGGITRYVRCRNVLTREVDSALLVLMPGGRDVLALKGAGPAIWSHLGDPISLDDLVQALARTFQVDPGEISPSVHLTVRSLVAKAVVREEAA